MAGMATVKRRQLRIREMLRVRATPEAMLKQLGAEGFKVSRPTLYRDLATLMDEDQKQLDQLGAKAFASEYLHTIESLKEQVRRATLVYTQAEKPWDKLEAIKVIAEIETTIMDLLAYGPTVVALRRPKETVKSGSPNST